MREQIWIALGILALTPLAWGQDELPPGHPPIGGTGEQMPPGHTAMGGEGEGEPGGALPPGHPALGGEGEGEDEGGGQMPPGHPAVGEGGQPPPGHMRIPGMGGSSLDAVRDDPALPRGTIVTQVVDAQGHPVPNARVELGILAQGNRERRSATTDAQGQARWDGLQTGSDHAYRIAVPNGPARFDAEPLQMTENHGYRVTVTRYGVTQSRQSLLLFVMRTFLEFAEEGDRIKVTQHLQFMNFGEDAIADPEGIPISLPEGYTAFRFDQGMGDQRLVDRDGKIWLEGSLPPGQTQVAYGFDLKSSGSEFSYRQPVPFRLVVAEVYAERAPHMKLRAVGMPEAEQVDIEGRAFLATRLARRPQSPRLPSIEVHLTNLPGPGVGRWIAVGLAVMLMGLGLSSYLSGGDRRLMERAAARAERERLLADAVRIEQQKEKGKLDEKAHARLRDRVVTRLAEILQIEENG
jgi:hypothetical protein